MDEKLYLIVMDFLYQKYEIEYEKNMSPQEVIRKVQPFLFPKEQNDDYFSLQNEESYTKFGLYRSDSPDFKGATFVTWNISPEECDYKKYQFYIFRPFINVFLPIYIVYENEEYKHKSKASLELIYPIKKKVKLLKNYLKDNIRIHIEGKEEFKSNPINGFTLKFVSDTHELDDEEYVEQWMNGKEIFLIVNPDNNINQNYFMPGRFYYIHYDPSSNEFSNITESLDETNGFTLSDTRKKLIRKHQEGKNFLEDNVLITFNSIMQTDQFDKLDDLFCDNDFYQFVVIFETSEININPIPETFEINEKRVYDIPVPKNGRPNIISFRMAGEPKRELKQVNQTSSNVDIINQPIESINDNETIIIDNDNETTTVDNNNETTIIDNDNEHVASENDNTKNNNDETNNTNSTDKPKNDEVETQNNEKNNTFIENSYTKENIIEPYIEEEEEVNDDDDDDESNNDNDKEKLLDMFSFYFLEFSKESQVSKKKTPNPTYFNNLSNDQIDLLKTFQKYYHLYRQQKH